MLTPTPPEPLVCPACRLSQPATSVRCQRCGADLTLLSGVLREADQRRAALAAALAAGDEVAAAEHRAALEWLVGESLPGPEPEPELAAARRLGVYGGAFDPPHIAHLLLADRAVAALKLDWLLLVPCGVPPLKAAAVATAEQRLTMVRLAVADRPRCRVSDIEIRRPGISYTVDTLAALVAEAPAAEWWLVLGSDAVAELPRWREPERLLELTRLAVAGRPGVGLTEALQRLPETWRSRVDTVDLPPLEVASSALRADLAAGRPSDPLLPPAVARYVAKLGLYRDA